MDVSCINNFSKVLKKYLNNTVNIYIDKSKTKLFYIKFDQCF